MLVYQRVLGLWDAPPAYIYQQARCSEHASKMVQCSEHADVHFGGTFQLIYLGKL